MADQEAPAVARGAPALEAWGGVECTVNRVGDRYHDQLALNGHADREGDLERFAALGIAALRYPVLWERTAPEGLARADFGWADRRLAALERLGLRPIVGLVHHGSGPRDTSLIDPDFPEGLEAYATAVAERYPWVREWSPVNEVVTTARFSALYGHWYPHARDDRTFVRALLNQCHGVRLAMRAIRRVVRDARLVQPEDLGCVLATPRLAYQAEFENERRLLAIELLSGRVGRGHPLRAFLVRNGATRGELDRFLADPCPPDVIGVNYYLTSDRFLDHRVRRYPHEVVGGNGRHRYADVEAVRVAETGLAGHRAILGELWDRYHQPLAITEVHAGCTREDQLRWLMEAWNAAHAARADGIDVRAVTAWALLGSFDWDRLVTRVRGHYEPGAFDVRSSPPRATAVARAIRALACGCQPDHATLAVPGWWHRPERVLYPPPRRAPEAGPAPALLIAGVGALGRAFAELASRRGIRCLLLGRAELDVADARVVERQLASHEPWAVVNATGFTDAERAERDHQRCWRDNVAGPRALAGACRARGAKLVTFSSDLVFNGRSRSRYRESSALDPLGVLGRSKREGERVVLDELPSALVVRTAGLFGPSNGGGVLGATLDGVESGRVTDAIDDWVLSPTYIPDLVEATLDLLVDGEDGVWHVANEGETTWAELARRAAELGGHDAELVRPCTSASLGATAPRPAFSALDSERGRLLAPLDRALERFVAERARSVTSGAESAPVVTAAATESARQELRIACNNATPR